MKINFLTIIRNSSLNSKWLIASSFAALFWYVSLFPGRLGYDPIIMIKMIEKNQSTDWWTPAYFWFLKITTFFGSSIWLLSLLSLIPMYFSMIYFLYSLNENKQRVEKIAFFTCISPLFGNFAVNINHDTFFTAGILLLLGYSLRIYFNSQSKVDTYVPYIAVVFFLTSKTGYTLILAMIIYIFLQQKKRLKTICIITFSLLLFATTSLGITKYREPVHFIPFLSDIKCVVQHPEARISQDEWSYLAQISSIQSWKSPKVCWSMDQALDDINLSNLNRFNFVDFLRTYTSITIKNPEIVIQAHLQRSSVALPPPFFQGPQNQVDRNLSNPVGLNTNTALQLGSVVLHPSIDYPRFKLNHNFLKPLESLAIFSSFLINQASWFWGWGGFWLWLILIYMLFKIKVRSIYKLLLLLYPLFLHHLLLILIGPAPLPRYVMATILVGFSLSLFLIAELLDRTKYKLI